jgi:flagellar biosynthetic protein FlhB
MSDQPDKSEQTEDPSERKLEEARKKGDVAKSQEVTTWFMLVGSAMLFAIMAPITAASLTDRLASILAHADQVSIGGSAFGSFFSDLAFSVMSVALLPLAAMAVFAVAGNMVQHAPLFTFETIKPKWSKVSPIAGAKRLFSSEALVNFVKGLFKIVIVGTVMFVVVWPERDKLDTIIAGDPELILQTFLALSLKVFIAVLAIVTVIAVADFMYQRYKWWERQKMTIKEVKDEIKNTDGDPQVKARIRQIRNERSRQRMMSAVPDATVVVTNPTHYAVALRYEKGMAAPVCVAKGRDRIALKIRELATEHDVPIVENPPLARALHASVDIDATIPSEHFKAVAQVIGYVMRLRDSARWRA